MLYKLKKENNNSLKIEPMEFKSFQSINLLEKDLENLISNNLFDLFFENEGLIPIHQERAQQPEADIYALNSKGDLIIFELKRNSANEDAVQQILRYAQEANKWTYKDLENKYQKYQNTNISLKEAHKGAFDLEEALLEKDFNQNQQLLIIGNTADKNLIEAVNYWNKNGVKIDFLPYKLYKFNNEIYFEFFSKPYDEHTNPSEIKGVLFDTNRTYNENAIWEMFENNYIAAYGTMKHVINYISKDDIVFLFHSGYGIVGACRVKGKVEKSLDNETWYRKVEFLLKKPAKDNLKAMSVSNIKNVLGKNFFWAKTIKVPYLSKKEAELLLEKLSEEIV